VTAATLTVKADDKSKTYGDANPALTGSITGIQNGDDITATYNTTATASSSVGDYAIEPSLTDPGNKLGNYNVTKTNGTLTIQYDWRGFLQPINDTAHQTGVSESKFKLGQTIPVKFDLYNAAGNVVQQAQNPTFTESNNLGSCDSTTTLEDPTTLSPDTAATYAYTGGHYQYNWSTKNLTAGEYRIYANLADGTKQYVDICLTK
jgi:MBG domain (YGX type)